MPIKVNGQTSGSVTVAAPDTGSDVTLTLPGTTMNLGTELASKLPIAGGKILQVVAASHSTQVSSSSSTYADTGVTATITPSSDTSKVLVIVNQVGLVKETNNTWVDLRLMRGATDIGVFGTSIGRNAAATFNGVGGNSISLLDTPSTTSATTYKSQFRSNQNNAVAYVQFESAVSTIVLMEVSA